jgi:hypothetical protein
LAFTGLSTAAASSTTATISGMVVTVIR